MVQENKNNHYHNVFNFQHSSSESSYSIWSSIFYTLILIDLSQPDTQALYGIQIKWYSALC